MRVTIASMRAAGMSDSAILKVVEEADAERREKERIKKRNQRLRPQDGGDNRDIGGQAKKAEQKQQSRPQDGGDNVHIKDTSLEPTKKKKVRKSISPDWVPDDRDCAYALARGWTYDQIETEAERCRNHWLANGKTMADWHAVWRNWVISPFQQRRRSQQPTIKERNREFLDDFAEYLNRPADQRPRSDRARAPDHLLLPVRIIDAEPQRMGSGANEDAADLFRASGGGGGEAGNAGEPAISTGRSAGAKTLR